MRTYRCSDGVEESKRCSLLNSGVRSRRGPIRPVELDNPLAWMRPLQFAKMSIGSLIFAQAHGCASSGTFPIQS